MIETHPVPSAQVRAYLDSLPIPATLSDRPLEELRREGNEQVRADSGEPEPVASAEDIDAGGVPARLYLPAGGERDVLIWFHGGGWMSHDVDSFDAITRVLANRAACAVLSVDYRLAPEHPFPAAIGDCWAATVWASQQFDRTAVGGDSAGGNLAAAVALRARDAEIDLALQLLVYPVTDYAVDSSFYDEFRRRYDNFAGRKGYGAYFQDGIRWIWERYVPEASRRCEQDASPLRAASLRRVAPAVIITAEHDILRGECEEYARRLEAEQVPVELHNYAGQIHGFFHMLGVMDDAHDAVDKSAAALRRAFTGS